MSTGQSICVLSEDACNSDDFTMGLWYGKVKSGDGRTQKEDDVEELCISDSAG